MDHQRPDSVRVGKSRVKKEQAEYQKNKIPNSFEKTHLKLQRKSHIGLPSWTTWELLSSLQNQVDDYLYVSDPIKYLIFYYYGPLSLSLPSHLWRSCTNSIPTMQHLLKRKLTQSSISSFCKVSEESTIHALQSCEKLQSI